MVTSPNSREYRRFDELAEEFAKRYRRGERPSLQEFVARLPEMADEIREMFPALVEVEEVEGDARNDARPPSQPSGPRLGQLGDYRIIREIGRGGMGVVYEAEQVSLGRHVALKVLPNQALKDVKQKLRFEREARAAARLHHTNIVPVFGVGEHDGLPYYVMQFIQGLGLDAVLDELNHIQPADGSTTTVAREDRLSRRGATAAKMAHSLMTGAFPRDDTAVDVEPTAAAPLIANAAEAKQETGAFDAATLTVASNVPDAPLPDSGHFKDSFSLSASSLSLPGSGSAVTGRKSTARKQTYWQSVANIGRQIAEALEYAHKQGVLHRDVKPSNLLLDLRGTVWVTDFGLAKVAGPGAENLTHTGDILGTLRYMPPEAFDGKSDARSDVYSLGLTLYELLALKPAFDEKERNKLIKQVTSSEPTPLDKVRNEIPRDLVTIVQKSIEREPARRYATADELAADLQRFIEDEPIQARRQTHLEKYVRWARHNPGIAALAAALSAVLVIATIGSLVVASQMIHLASDASLKAADERLARLAAVRAQTRETAERTKAENAQKSAENSFALARNSEKQATEQRKRADRSAEVAQENLYYAQIHLAQQAWRDHRGLPHMRELLDNWLPGKNAPDRRGWEWFYLNSLPYHNVRAFTGNGNYNPCNVVTWHFPTGRLAQGTSDGLIRIWDVERERTTLSLRGPVPADAWEGTKWLAWSPDGSKLAAGYQDGKVYLYETRAGRKLRVIKAHSSPVRTVAFSSHGARLATWGQDAGTRIWDVNTGQMTTEVIGVGSVDSGAWSPDNQILASGHSDGTLTITDIRTRDKSVVLSAYHTAIYDLSFSPDSSQLATASQDFTAKIWDVSSRTMIHGPLRHSHRIASVSWEPGGKRLATGSVDEAVKIWNASTGHEEMTLRGNRDRITSIAWGPNGRLASACVDGGMTIWNSIRDQESRILTGHAGEVLRVCWSPDGKRLASSGEVDGEVRIWDPVTRKVVQTVNVQAGTNQALAWHPDGRRLALGGYNSVIKVWDLASNREVFSLPTGHGWVRSLAFSPDGKNLAAGSDDTIQIIEEVGSTPKVKSLQAEQGTVFALSWSPNGDLLASGGQEGIVKLWDPVRGSELVRTKVSQPADVLGLAWSPDGKRLASAMNNRMVILWDSRTGQQLRTLRGHNDYVAAVCWSPDGTRLATAGLDNSVRVWDPQTGEETVVLRGDYGFFYDVSWNPDGAQLAAASSDHQIWIWDATRGFERDTTPRALPYIDRAVASGSAKGEDPRWYAESYLRAGKFADALLAVKDDPSGLYKLARQCEQAGHPKLANEARAHAREGLENQLKAEPDNAELASQLADLLLQSDSARWTVLRPTVLKSAKGTTLTLLADASILVSGKNVGGDIYTVAGLGDLDRITTIRLEVLPHPSLPNGGPGRHPSGNFQLSALQIFETSKDDAQRRTELPLDSVWASYDYKAHDADIAGTIDEKLNKVWHVWLRWGQAHEAVYWLKEAAAVRGRAVSIDLRHRGWRSDESVNLGRFRLSVSSDLATERKRFLAMKQTDPWAKLAAAYYLMGKEQALRAVIERYPGAASFKGDVHAANRQWEQAIAEYSRLVSSQPTDADLSAKLAATYQSAGRTRESIPFLASLSAADPSDIDFTLKVAALQAWFGQDKEWGETCVRGLEFARNTSSAMIAEQIAKVCCLRPTPDKSRRDSAVFLARKAVELGKAGANWPRFQIALGMAKFRNGQFAQADLALRTAMQGAKGMFTAPETSAFFRAMSLFQQGKEDEARKLAAAAATTMWPLPKDEQNPLGDNVTHDVLIMWLAYKEAKAMIKFDPVRAATSRPMGN
jgi:WD40 repeat protein/serine/threonine protein kinase/tetratricopeptide (TPR) repeat protein